MARPGRAHPPALLPLARRLPAGDPARILDGRFDDAERLAQRGARGSRGCATASTPRTSTSTRSSFAIRWAQGRLGEYWPEVAHHGERYLWIPRWRDALAAAELGDRAGRGVRAGDATPAHGFADIPRDGFWLLRLSLPRRGLRADRRRARPRGGSTSCCCRSRTATPSPSPSCRSGPWRCASAMLADAARAPGGGGAALRGRAGSLRAARREGGARARAARVRAGAARPAATPSAPPRCSRRRAASARTSAFRASCGRRRPARAEPETRFVREGEFWTIAYAGTTMRLRDVKGLRYIATLLAAPGLRGPRARAGRRREATAGRSTATSRTRSTRRPRRSTAPGSRTCAPSSRRHAALRDDERAAGLEEEIDALVGELAQAVGPGRPRPAAARRPPSAPG